VDGDRLIGKFGFGGRTANDSGASTQVKSSATMCLQKPPRGQLHA
jgi:hypothetical protein